MRAKSISGLSPFVIKKAIEACKADGFAPTLAFVFISDVKDAKEISELLNNDSIRIFGVSTSDKFTENGIQQEGIVVLLLDINPDFFKIVLHDYSQFTPYEAAKKTGEAGLEAFSNPGFIISSADIRMSGEDLISGLADTAGQTVTVMGGVAGNPADFTGVVFTNNMISPGGLLALIIDQDRVTINGIAVSGWKPAGTEKKITSSEGSWIYTIDDEPAMNVIQKFLGSEIVTFNRESQGLVPLDAGYPLQFQRPSGTPMMRPVLLWNTGDRSVLVGGPVKEGDTFRFSLPPDFDVIDSVVESSKMIRRKSLPEIDALIVFSCVGRLGSLGPMIASEIEGLASTWNKPMAGFFSLGEFGKLDESRCEYHGTTVSWVALREN